MFFDDEVGEEAPSPLNDLNEFSVKKEISTSKMTFSKTPKPSTRRLSDPDKKEKKVNKRKTGFKRLVSEPHKMPERLTPGPLNMPSPKAKLAQKVAVNPMPRTLPLSDIRTVLAANPWLCDEADHIIELDNVTRLMRDTFSVPYAFVCIVGDDDIVFKSKSGFTLENFPSKAESGSFLFQQSVNSPGVFCIPDCAGDSRCFGSKLVIREPSFRFYAACPFSLPLISKGCTLPVGAVCMADKSPRSELSDADRMSMVRFSSLCVSVFSAHGLKLEKRNNDRRAVVPAAGNGDAGVRFSDSFPGLYYVSEAAMVIQVGTRGGATKIMYANPAAASLLGVSDIADLIGADLLHLVADQGSKDDSDFRWKLSTTREGTFTLKIAHSPESFAPVSVKLSLRDMQSHAPSNAHVAYVRLERVVANDDRTSAQGSIIQILEEIQSGPISRTSSALADMQNDLHESMQQQQQEPSRASTVLKQTDDPISRIRALMLLEENAQHVENYCTLMQKMLQCQADDRTTAP